MARIFAGIAPLYAASTIVSLGLIGYLIAVTEPTERDSVVKVLILIICGVAIWSLADLIGVSITTLDGRILARQLEEIGSSIVVIGWFVLAATYTDRDRWRSKPVLLTIVSLFGVSNFLVMTTQFHGLMWSNPRFPDQPQYTTLAFDSGPLWPVFLALYFALTLAGIYAFMQFSLASREIYRGQSIALIVSATVPMLGTLKTILRLPPYPSADISSVAFIITCVALIAAVVRYRLLSVVPMAHDTIVESMDNGVVVLSADNRVAEINPRAEEILARHHNDLIGADFEAAFSELPVIPDTIGDEFETQTQVSTARDGKQSHYEITVSPVTSTRSEMVGRTVILREITGQKEREQKLDLMRQVQSRVLRHNIRNDMQIIRATVETATEQFDEEHTPIAERALETADQLLSVSAKARAVEQLVDKKQSATTVDLSQTLSQIVDVHRDSHSEVSFTVDCPDQCHVKTIPAIELAFENLIENAAEHNTSDNPIVTVSVETSGDQALVTIRDNGPGIPNHEITVIEQAEETPLEHGTGIGLWVVQWVLDNTAGTIEYDIGANGTTITVQLPCATDD